MDHKHHVGQIRKNWGVITLLLLIVFSAGVVWAFTERDFVEMETFEVHVEAEQKYIEEKFDSQEKLIEQKFKNTDAQIEHLDEHLEDIKELLE